MTKKADVWSGAGLPALVVFSHLRWDSPYRRPREILSRLAARTRVLFVEEPCFHAGHPSAIVRVPDLNVTVLTPRTPLNAPGFHDDQIPLLSKLVANALAREQMRAYGVWLDTPMALPLLKKLEPTCIVYDCIADLAQLPGAPRQIAQREHALLRMANVVICASPGLWRTRRAQRDDARLIADSVDAAHFACAADGRFAHPAVRALARPRLGYAGIIDERVDWDLLRAVAEARPEWEICLVGPIAHADPSALPHAPNLHYFDECTHADLPMHIAGWDVALLPMVRDDAAHFTATATALQYMAAGRPIVSTPIRDVARFGERVIRFGASVPAFIAACEATLTEPAADRARSARGMASIVRTTNWDETVRGVSSILDTAAAEGLTDVAQRMLQPAQSAVGARTPRLPTRSPCVILGAGATGLATAYHYGAGCTLVEREAQIGGGCRSIEDTGFTFDRGLHVMASDDPHVEDLYRLLLGDNVHWQECDAQVLSGDGGTPDLPTVALGDRAPASRARFGYPLRGGFAALVNGFMPLLRADIVLRADVRKVSPLLRTVTLADGRRLRYDILVSTLPLPRLVAAMEDEAPIEIRRAAAALRHTSLRCVNLGVARPHVTMRHWIEVRDTVFSRVIAQGNLSPHCNPPGGFGLTCEIPYSPAAPLPATGAALTDRCVRDLVRVGLLHRSDGLLTSNQVDVAYASITADGEDAAARIRDWLAHFAIVPAGRFGAWHDGDAFVAGRNAALAAERGSIDRVAAAG